MAWEGWFEYAGSEIINVARTETYVLNSGATWLKPQYKNESLGLMLGDAPYRSPLLDDAPWLDPDIPESADFFGLYPLEVTGLEDSSRTATVIESLSDGGVPGRTRNATKQVAYNMALLAGTQAGAAYGIRWLKQALNQGVCSTDSACDGEELCYLAYEPLLESSERTRQILALLDGGYFITLESDEPDLDGGTPTSDFNSSVEGGGPNADQDLSVQGGHPADNFDEDILEDTAVTDPVYEGGFVTASGDLDMDGGDPWGTGGLIDSRTYPFNLRIDPGEEAEDCLTPLRRSLRKVSFNTGPSITAKNRMQDGSEVWRVTFTAVAGDPWELSAEVPVIEGFMNPAVEIPWAGGIEPDGAAIDLDGTLFPEHFCDKPTYRAIYDPVNPAMVEPPSPPNVPLGSYVPPLNWKRRQISIPKEFVPLWGDVVPKIQVHASTGDLRNLRVRFYADPYGIGDITEDPCAYCGDIVFSYVPMSHSLIFDGSEQTVKIMAPGGGMHRADSLVFKTDGTPFEWPLLTCGYAYVVTLDLPQTQAPPYVDISLFARAT